MTVPSWKGGLVSYLPLSVLAERRAGHTISGLMRTENFVESILASVCVVRGGEGSPNAGKGIGLSLSRYQDLDLTSLISV